MTQRCLFIVRQRPTPEMPSAGTRLEIFRMNECGPCREIFDEPTVNFEFLKDYPYMGEESWPSV